jgi:hypothetical protein
MAKAEVCIWTYTGFTFLGDVLGVGHAALKLKTTKQEHYITWIAPGHPTSALFPSQAKGAFDGLGNVVEVPERLQGKLGFERSFDYKWDQLNMKGFFGHAEPDHTIKLPTLSLPPSDEGFRHGVDVDRIERFWKRRSNLDVANRERKYAFLSKKQNCTGCVVEALRAGGLDCYIEKPNNWFVQDAKTLLTWVREAEAKIKWLNELQSAVNDKMDQLVVDPKIRVPEQQKSIIPRYEEWKADSDRNVSFRAFAQRKEQIAALDAVIKDYHSTAETDKLTRFVLLVKMQSLIYSHMTLKPRSDRAEAVKRLGLRVTLVLKDLFKGGQGFAQVSDESHRWVLRTLADTGVAVRFFSLLS